MHETDATSNMTQSACHVIATTYSLYLRIFLLENDCRQKWLLKLAVEKRETLRNLNRRAWNSLTYTDLLCCYWGDAKVMASRASEITQVRRWYCCMQISLELSKVRKKSLATWTMLNFPIFVLNGAKMSGMQTLSKVSSVASSNDWQQLFWVVLSEDIKRTWVTWKNGDDETSFNRRVEQNLACYKIDCEAAIEVPSTSWRPVMMGNFTGYYARELWPLRAKWNETRLN